MKKPVFVFVCFLASTLFCLAQTGTPAIGGDYGGGMVLNIKEVKTQTSCKKEIYVCSKVDDAKKYNAQTGLAQLTKDFNNDPNRNAGFKDWYVPSNDDLIAMYENLHKKGLGGFKQIEYASGNRFKIVFKTGAKFGGLNPIHSFSTRMVRKVTENCSGSAGTWPAICDVDKSKMIPLRDATYRAYQYVAKLSGSAIKGNAPYEIHFDTGSWTTSIPYGAIDKSKIKVLEVDVRDSWGNLADKVSGQLTLKSVDGTPYTIDNYVFFATKNDDKTDLADDRGQSYGNGTKSIMGAFPSKEPGRQLPSLPYAIAEKYSATNALGLGIVSDCKNDIQKDWSSFKSYLQIGSDPKVTGNLQWRTDVPLWHPELGFCPEAVPGFKVTIQFPNTPKTIKTNTLIATVDTGAPDMTLKLGSDDPQNQAPFSDYFVKDGPWKAWNNPGYNASATTLKNAKVTVEFTDSNGKSSSYSFPVGNDIKSTLPPATLYAGTWLGDVPWHSDSDVLWPANTTTAQPRNRINLGNTVYFYCPVYFWDIKNKRVGIAFR